MLVVGCWLLVVSVAMNLFQTILILLFAFLGVFAEGALTFPRSWLGAQVDVLPALMVYAALNSRLLSVVSLAVCGGLWADTFSANPFGISILPLFAVGFPIFLQRELVLRDLPFAQIVLGAIAGAAVPALTLLLLLSGGHKPVFGWGTLWQFVVMSLGSALVTPLVFNLLEWAQRAFGYQERGTNQFRLDREIRRGKILKK
jgi:hypothetical protein